MFGAESAVGVEIDPIAIQSAYRNAEMNGIETVFLLPEETREGASRSLARSLTVGEGDGVALDEGVGQKARVEEVVHPCACSFSTLSRSGLIECVRFRKDG